MSPATLAARESAAVFVLEGRTHLEITGADRAKFLHNFCTNDIKSLRPGQACEAFICNVKGRALGHVTVFVDEDSLWLETVPDAGPKLMAHLDRYIIVDDVQLHDRTSSLLALHVVGPKALEAVALGRAANGNDSLSAVEDVMGVGSTWFRCVDWFGSDSFLWIGDPVEIRAMHGVFAAGISSETVVGTAADWEALRIDAGFPQYGSDITEDNLPQEVGRTARCISFRKGCYLGQEPIARLDAMGHTNRELRRLISTSADIPARGTELLDSVSQQPVGHITSAAVNPFGDGVVALGYLKSQYQASGTKVLCRGEEFTVRPDDNRSPI